MSDGDVLPPSVPFTRGTKARASLPTGRSSGQARDRPLGVLYLQYGEETKQVRMPSEISSVDTLRALFVTAFPHQLTMKMLQSPNMAIYTKDTDRNVYYNLEDVRNITPHSCLKAYHKDPAHVFNRHARPANSEGRISKEVLYGSHSPVHSLTSSSRLHGLQGSMSPPMVRSMPSSPSRVAYAAGGGVRGRGPALAEPGTSTLPRETSTGPGRSGGLCNSSSAILQRRDVKPDEDIGISKSLALVVRGDGAHYADSCCSSLLDGAGGRLSMSSSQCSGPPSLTGDLVDAGTLGIQQYRASVKPLMGYGESQTCSLHRQKSRKYGDSQLPSLGTKTPPASPHRLGEVRLSEGQIIGGVGLVSPDRMSPMRRSLRRESNGATVEVVSRSRGSSSSTSSVFVDSPLGQTDRHFQAFGTPNNSQRSSQLNFGAEGGVAGERMKAMEEQIASLAGLVHHALSIGPDGPGVKEAVSESPGKLYSKKLGGPSEPRDSCTSSPAPTALRSPPLDGTLQRRLVSAQRNVCELREQLNQLKCLQLSNQRNMSSMLRMAGQELVGLMSDQLAQSEEAAYGRRAEMEEERTNYLATEEQILTQLSELENYVDRLQRSSGSSPSQTSQTSLTLRDVEEGAVNLRRVGEALAVLKGEFPELQLKMRSVLRLEVEAVRFLKEEPHKMDAMLKRVKALTESLSSLRRQVSESVPATRVQDPDQQASHTESPQSSPKPQPRSSVRPPLSGSQAEAGSAGSASPVMSRRKKSSVAPPTQHCPSPPLTPAHGRDAPSVAKVSPRSREGSPALQRRAGPPPSDPDHRVLTTPHQTTITERQNPEGSLRAETSTSQSNQSTSTSTDLDQVLQKTQESLLKSIPHLEVSDPTASRSDPVSGQESPLTLTPNVEPQARLPKTQQSISPKPSDEVDTTHLKVSDTVTMETPPSAPPAAAPAAPPSASPIPERRPHVEKPRRSSLDKEMKQSLDKASKSPPPPPPRRVHAVSSGKSGELLLTTRTEPIGAQDEVKVKEPPAVPQPKPPRQPPEIKPKPQICAALLAASTPPPAAAPAPRQRRQEEEDEEDEEEEDNKFMKELQVKTDGLKASHSPGGNDQKAERKVWKPSTNLYDLTSGNQPTPQMGMTNGSPVKLRAVPTDYSESGKTRVNLSENTVKDKAFTLGPPADCAPVWVPRSQQAVGSQEVHSHHTKKAIPTPSRKEAKETESPKVSVSLAENNQTITSPKQVVEQVFSPTTTEKKIKYTTIVTLQKENIQEPVTSPKSTPEKAFKGAPAEKKSNVTVVVTLQKDNPSEDTSTEPSSIVQQNTSVSFHQESPPVQKPSPLSPSSPYSSPYGHSSTLQTQEAPVQGSTDQSLSVQSLSAEEGGTLSPSGCDDEGPPPPPPAIGKFRLSTSKKRTQSKEEDQAKTNGSGVPGGGTESVDDIFFVGQENQGFEDMDEFDNRPIIVILNEPMDIQSAYKRLSTIFESEEDLETLLSESIMEEEETIQEDDEQGVRTFCLDRNSMGLRSVPSSPQIQHERSSAGNTSAPGDQNETGTPQKTETKRKFKFKFPKNKLAALGLALRANKSEKKTLQVVVYEEEEDTGPDIKSPKDIKKTKSFEIVSRKQSNVDKTNANNRDVKTSPTKSHTRVEELCKNTFDSIHSLEESIKQLEVSVDSIKAPVSSPPQSPDSSFEGTDRPQLKGKARRDREKSPSKRPATQILKGPNPPDSKRARPQPAPDPAKSSSRKQTPSSSSSSSVLRSHTKSRHSSSSGSPEKSSKGQQQKQPSQPRVVAIPR